MASLVQTEEEKGGFVDRLTHGQEARKMTLSGTVETENAMHCSPVILQDAPNAVLPKSLGYIGAFFLRQRNPSVIIIDAQFAVEVASICIARQSAFNSALTNRNKEWSTHPERASRLASQMHSKSSHRLHAYAQRQ